MVRRTDAAYGCGPLALFNAARQLSGIAPVELLEIASPAPGFSFQKQVELAGKFPLPMVAAVCQKGTQMVTPAAVHWRENPSAAVIAEQNYPQVQRDDCPSPNGGNCCEDCQGGYDTGSETDAFGMATWKVQEPNINLKLQDIPMSSAAAFFQDYVLKLQWGRRVAERPPILRRRLQPEEYGKRLPHFPAFSKRTEHLGDGLYERGLDSAGGFEEHRRRVDGVLPQCSDGTLRTG